MSYKNLGDYEQAIRDHTKAVEISPNFAAAYYNLGCVYWIQKNWQEVVGAWEKCLEINSNYEKALEWLPKAREEGGF
jgi:tetratricopeptide (TPR) repeat protein